MSANARNVLCRYQYDPLDRLIGATPTSEQGLRRFYCQHRIATEIQGEMKRSIFQHNGQLLAQQEQLVDLAEASLLATDKMRSVLHMAKVSQHYSVSYSPYGHSPTKHGLPNLLGFNGERVDSITGHYSLGNGYRAFNPVLMRFNSPDCLSPFRMGGINAYAYCLGDPINRHDENGHFSWLGGVASGMDFISAKLTNFFLASKKKSLPLVRKISAGTGGAYVAGKNGATNKFVNLKPENLPKELRAYQKMQKKSSEPLIKQISQGEDLNNLKFDASYKFVMHADDSFFVGGPISVVDRALKHPVLSHTVRRPQVISAGMVRKALIEDDVKIIMWNKTGHFKTDFESLTYAKNFLNDLGAEVELHRKS